jgi:hypothetical protein
VFIVVLIDHQISRSDEDIMYIETNRSVAWVGKANLRLCYFAYELLIS